MAKGVDFPQSNRTLGPPDGVEKNECDDLPVQLAISAQRGPCFISCWQLTPEEVASIVENGGKIYLWVLSSGHPMVCLSPHYAEGMRDLLGKQIDAEDVKNSMPEESKDESSK